MRISGTEPSSVKVEIKAQLLIWFYMYISAIKNDLMNLNILSAFKN